MHVEVWTLVLIFTVNFVYITLNTIRYMLTMKGYRTLAPIISMVEITVYVVGLSLVLNRLDNILNIIAYALGYGVGVRVGIWVEDKLALGYIMATVILPNTDSDLPKILRQNGFGVTQSSAQGLEGQRLVLDILTPRNQERRLYAMVNEAEPKAFIITYEPKYISGGFWVKRVRNRHFRP
ncbi:hypothetical protein AYR62_08090 [Secundilactobacillus paracollinoides]|uniref:UPF0316 protein AYR63_14985 n=1 Tax=Secundilactobacillus paracollinoides TaxID=240427 RepID=A0A1B2J223_9LACO|nr:DUF2179 domain-containing protein [Secundilactobacillus paracollinoides]ANZ62352.1 hypothetical protein AYR61_14110 [Secundilactobacillus paracollinoides]ANZ64039.1 hypothetical protein AYR62_08090 [Secundilactobacillus paracollinoides]ANZ68299.1 hypothetical protein AYR63_14985 [Secundilactobacillus paracollinoides]KRL77541.1 hypothetical protein FC17_GL001216 [Secundilactobacillus paracollinoides DSM 15502 = JCM 11969]